MRNVEELLLGIAKCPNVPVCLEGQSPSHPCSKVVASQGSPSLESFQVPEPWNGQLHTAPLLFLSSNPSVSGLEAYPAWSWGDDDIQDFFSNRFGGGKRPWVVEGNYALKSDGTRLKATPYWAETRNRASELLGRTAIPGIDYALTEVVHCKSARRLGVPEAVHECARRYLTQVLHASAATVVVVVGKDAAVRVREFFAIRMVSRMVGPSVVAGQLRLLLFLDAPGSAKRRVLAGVLEERQIKQARDLLGG